MSRRIIITEEVEERICGCDDPNYCKTTRIRKNVLTEPSPEMVERAVLAHTKAEGFISPLDDAFVSMRAALTAALWPTDSEEPAALFGDTDLESLRLLTIEESNAYYKEVFGDE